MSVLQNKWKVGEGNIRLKILVVDDDELNQKMMHIILEQEGHEVYIATGGLDALRAVEEREFDIILMDLQMPDLDGVETSRRIRKSANRSKQAYIVALTASYLPEKGRELFESGIDNYLAKPFELQRLHQIIRYGTGRRSSGKGSGLPSPAYAPNPVLQQDFDPVVGIKLVGGDEETFRGLLADFVRQLPEKVVAAEKHLEQNDIVGLSRVAHTIKGVSLNLGGLQLYEYASRLEYYSSESYTASEELKKDLQTLKAKSLQFIDKASVFLAGE